MATTQHIAIDRKQVEDGATRLVDYAKRLKALYESPTVKDVQLKDGGDCFSLGLAETFSAVRTHLLTILEKQGDGMHTLSSALHDMVDVWTETEEENRNSANFYNGHKAQSAKQDRL